MILFFLITGTLARTESFGPPRHPNLLPMHMRPDRDYAGTHYSLPAELEDFAVSVPPPRDPLPGTGPDPFDPWAISNQDVDCCMLLPAYDPWLADPQWYDVLGRDAVDQLRIFMLPTAAEQVAQMLALLDEFPCRGPDMLYKAVQRGNVDVLRALLDRGVAAAPPGDGVGMWEYREGPGETPIHEAAYRGCLECIQMLVQEAGVHPDAGILRGSRLFTPLTYAVEQGHLDVVEWLLDTGRVNPARMQWTPSAKGILMQTVDDLLITDVSKPPLLNMTAEAMGFVAGLGSWRLRPESHWDMVKLFVRWTGCTPPPKEGDVRSDKFFPYFPLSKYQRAVLTEGFRRAAGHGRYETMQALASYLSLSDSQPLIAQYDISSDLIKSLMSSIENMVWNDNATVFKYLTQVTFGLPGVVYELDSEAGLQISEMLEECLENAVYLNSVQIFRLLIDEYWPNIHESFTDPGSMDKWNQLMKHQRRGTPPNEIIKYMA